MYPVKNSIEKGVHQPQAPAYASERGTHTIGAGCALHARAFLLQRQLSLHRGGHVLLHAQQELLFQPQRSSRAHQTRPGGTKRTRAHRSMLPLPGRPPHPLPPHSELMRIVKPPWAVTGPSGCRSMLPALRSERREAAWVMRGLSRR